MNSHLPYFPTTEDPIGIGPPPSLHSSLSPTFSTGHTSASGDWMPGHNGFTEFTRKKEISKGPMVWCNPDLKAFGYEHPLFLTSLFLIYSRDHLLTFDIVAYNGRRSVMRRVGIPTGGVAIGCNAWTNHEGVVRQIASLPDDPVSEDSVRAHISKSQGMRKLGQQGARDPKAVALVSPPPFPGCVTSADAEGETNLNYALSPGSSVAPSPVPPTPITKKEYHHPTSLGGFLGTNPYGPQAYIGVPSQVSSPELPGPFAFEDGLPRWTKTAEPLSDPLFQQEKIMKEVANMMPNKRTHQAIIEENIPRILSTAFVERSASQVTGLAVIGVVEQSLLLSKSNASTKWYFVVDKVEAPRKFRGECYETVKIQREVTLNQSAIKGRSGSIEAVNESTCNIVKEYLDPSKPIGNL
ncbi:hypothetical protein BY996DRAFT_6553462 [Phakopsora pachyrhizi]|nr:hypothetical protein BY996DRAFT_6553462 [Phakopsora pachyrhizi]